MVPIKELKPDYQDVIILRFVEDLSLKDTATILKKSEGAVKLAQHRAIKELKKKLGDEHFTKTMKLSDLLKQFKTIRARRGIFPTDAHGDFAFSAGGAPHHGRRVHVFTHA
jgi:hypothetical protein